ncbi:MAG: GntR family transcriptional regulator [Rhizobium sp.]|nr:GntR family transcriptional regulator [Rhizobium sp.]
MKQLGLAEKPRLLPKGRASDGGDATSLERYSDKAYDILRDRLVRLHYAPMQPLNERSLTVDLEIGLAPIREALRRLEGEHLVVIYPRRGIFAAEIGVRDQQSIKEVRVEIEGLAAALAAARATAQERKALVEFAEELYCETEVDKLMAGDETFHRMIYAMARNAFLEPTLIQHYGLAIRLWYFCALNSWMPEITPAADHKELAAAISIGNSERARELLRAHVQHGSDNVRDLLFKAIEQ